MAMPYCPVPKPAPRVKTPRKGPTARLRARKARIGVLAERAIKSLVKDLDGRRCRWPGCEVPPDGFWGRLEAAHVAASGMGGDPGLARCTVANLITLCAFHHRGPRGLHSGLAAMEPHTYLGTRGPVVFWVATKQPHGTTTWRVAGVKSPPKELG